MAFHSLLVTKRKIPRTAYLLDSRGLLPAVGIEPTLLIGEYMKLLKAAFLRHLFLDLSAT